jgi:hypothetical protein
VFGVFAGLIGGKMVGIALRRNGQETEPEDERLLTLFRNRSELKKEFAKLRRSGEKLQEQLQQQEGETLRSQQQLEQLEDMLAHPVQAANASVFYQLRSIWVHCHRKLERLNEHLLTYRHEQEIKLELNQFNAIKKEAIGGIAKRGQEARIQYDKTVAEFESLKRQHEELRGFWNYLKRRSIALRIVHAATLQSAAAAELKECLEQVKAKEDMPLPEFGELSLEGRRSINLMLIAVAQELYLHFSEQNVSTLTREASVREVADVNYGDINACRALNIHIEKCMRSLPNGQELVVNAHQRMLFLEKNGDYRLETDTIPAAGSFSEIPLAIDEGGVMHGQKAVSVNVLADEYWDVCAVLLN